MTTNYHNSRGAQRIDMSSLPSKSVSTSSAHVCDCVNIDIHSCLMTCNAQKRENTVLNVAVRTPTPSNDTTRHHGNEYPASGAWSRKWREVSARVLGPNNYSPGADRTVMAADRLKTRTESWTLHVKGGSPGHTWFSVLKPGNYTSSKRGSSAVQPNQIPALFPMAGRAASVSGFPVTVCGSNN